MRGHGLCYLKGSLKEAGHANEQQEDRDEKKSEEIQQRQEAEKTTVQDVNPRIPGAYRKK
jgi:hypothetical protein